MFINAVPCYQPGAHFGLCPADETELGNVTKIHNQPYCANTLHRLAYPVTLKRFFTVSTKTEIMCRYFVHAP
jgi:hypothetical protein